MSKLLFENFNQAKQYVQENLTYPLQVFRKEVPEDPDAKCIDPTSEDIQKQIINYNNTVNDKNTSNNEFRFIVYFTNSAERQKYLWDQWNKLSDIGKFSSDETAIKLFKMNNEELHYQYMQKFDLQSSNTVEIKVAGKQITVSDDDERNLQNVAKQTGVFIITKTPDVKTLTRSYNRFLSMAPNFREISDSISIQTIGIDNYTHYQLLLRSFRLEHLEINTMDHVQDMVNESYKVKDNIFFNRISKNRTDVNCMIISENKKANIILLETIERLSGKTDFYIGAVKENEDLYKAIINREHILTKLKSQLFPIIANETSKQLNYTYSEDNFGNHIIIDESSNTFKVFFKNDLSYKNFYNTFEGFSIAPIVLQENVNLIKDEIIVVNNIREFFNKTFRRSGGSSIIKEAMNEAEKFLNRLWGS